MSKECSQGEARRDVDGASGFLKEEENILEVEPVSLKADVWQKFPERESILGKSCTPMLQRLQRQHHVSKPMLPRL